MNTAVARVARLTVAPDGMVARVFLSFLATAGFFYVNIMAALVSGLIEALHFTPSDAGLVASCNVYGAALGALSVVFVVAHLPWRRTAWVLLIGLMAADALSMAVVDVHSMMALRFVHGLLGGSLVGLTYSIIARTSEPDRTFGVLLVVQFGLGGAAILLLPPLVPQFGTAMLFSTLIAFSLVALVMMKFLGDYPPVVKAGAAGVEAGRDGAGAVLVLTLLVIFLFQGGNMGLAAYVIEIGRTAGLGIHETGTALAVANWCGIPGAALVVLLPARFGRLWPLIIGIVLTAAGSWALRGSDRLWVYFVANVVVAFCWSMCIAYLLGMCAQLRGDGRMAVVGGFVSKLGLASGPYACALALKNHGYGPLIDVSALLLLLSGALCFMPALILDRARRVAG